ncbi:hypothetical protein HMPREF9134_01178 [Porphyromonas catoniae F0037]|uniref:Uncharacterized protein n=1 Tax=Porphyromonas catoniae F0037 TaxID=1127696 RepID=L1NBZ6_9PORP|nr:hypothetical protein HMPREF9134_01178 [Porphyromonas catoniae F0037]
MYGAFCTKGYTGLWGIPSTMFIQRDSSCSRRHHHDIYKPSRHTTNHLPNRQIDGSLYELPQLSKTTYHNSS